MKNNKRVPVSEDNRHISKHDPLAKKNSDSINDEEKIDLVASKILNKYRRAFEELAK